ncbi:MAG: hypothetical protein IPP74_05055 [Alphaproteobacteria bacterium]|nr:hypothetical protein [Alphaproteobacteria bacterium]
MQPPAYKVVMLLLLILISACTNPTGGTRQRINHSVSTKPWQIQKQSTRAEHVCLVQKDDLIIVFNREGFKQRYGAFIQWNKIVAPSDTVILNVHGHEFSYYGDRFNEANNAQIMTYFEIEEYAEIQVQPRDGGPMDVYPIDLHGFKDRASDCFEWLEQRYEEKK